MKTMSRTRYRIALGASAALVALGILVALFLNKDSYGGTVSGARLERAERSARWSEGQFHNLVATKPMVDGGYWVSMKQYFSGGASRVPKIPIPTATFDPVAFAKADGLQAVWLGHSTALLRLDGITILTDPVFDDEVSISMGLNSTGRFFASPIAREQLPPIDIVILSHDHWDHLEQSTVEYFSSKPTRFVVPLAVGAHLERWGMSADQIVEVDWWDTTRVGSVDVICTPARHLSGRSPLQFNRTLWSSWSIVSGRHRIFFSGDTGPGDHFAEIGMRYGPFDLTLMQIGAYGDLWPDIHTTPEEVVAAQIALGGRCLLPVHWGTFDLALHKWDEPIVRLTAAAVRAGVQLTVPRPGQLFDADDPPVLTGWWGEGGEGRANAE